MLLVKAFLAGQKSQLRPQYRVQVRGDEAKRLAPLFPSLGSPPSAGRTAGAGLVRWLHVTYEAESLSYTAKGYIHFNVDKRSKTQYPTDFWSWSHAAYHGEAIPIQVLFTVRADGRWQADVLTGPAGCADDPAPDVSIDGDEFDPTDDTDARERVMRSIALRRGQPAFRNALLTAYDGRCAFSRCDVAEALEAAHIAPFRGEHTHHVTNGLLLRADLHTLFDRRLLAVDPESWKILTSPSLGGTHYDHLSMKTLHLPADKNERPLAAVLYLHREECDF